MNKYIKNNYDVNKDSMEWSLLKTSAFFVKENREQQAEKEIIDSYVCCMNKICAEIKKEFRYKIHLIKTYSLCIPYLYICRHLIELVLKKSIENETKKIKNGHNIMLLWKECKQYNSDKNLEYYDELIDTFNSMDDNGEKFRYVKDRDGNEFENKPVFLNVDNIKNDINCLIKDIL